MAQLLPSVGEAAQRGEPWLLNVNIPNRPANEIRGFKVARLGRRHAAEQVISQTNPRGDTMYWIGGAGPAKDDTEGTDFHAVAQGYATITPLQVDLTEHAALPAWRDWIGQGEGARAPRRRGAPSFRFGSIGFPLRRRPGRGPTCCARSARSRARMRMRRAACCPRASGSIRPAFVRAWQTGCARPASPTRRCSRRWPRCRVTCSSMPRSSRRPTRTPGCRSGTARPSRSRRSSRA